MTYSEVFIEEPEMLDELPTGMPPVAEYAAVIAVGGAAESIDGGDEPRAAQAAVKNLVPALERKARRRNPDGDESRIDTTDTIGVYLRDIGRYPLLNKDQEIELAKAIEAGKAAGKELEETTSRIRQAARSELCAKVIAGEAAWRDLVNANLRLVVSIAKKYQASGLSLPDLIQEGNIGLFRAADKFDWKKGFKFSTYATWWIRQSVTRGISNTARTIRLPVAVGEDLSKLRKATTIAMEDPEISTFEQIAKEAGLDPEKARHIREYDQKTVSIAEPISHISGSEATLEDIIADPKANVAEDGTQFEFAGRIDEILGCLDPEERFVIEQGFGLNGQEPMKHSEIAEALGKNDRYPIYIIKRKAMEKLANALGSDKEQYLDMLPD